MGAIVNQNHISDIVRANVQLTANIVQIISGISGAANSIMGVVNNFKTTMDNIYGPDGNGGLMKQIIDINENLDHFNKIRILPGRERLIKFHFNEIRMILKHMRKLGRGTWFMNDDRIQRATTVINYLKDINESLNSIEFNPMLSFNLELLANALDVLNDDIIPKVRNISLWTLLVNKKGLGKVTNDVFPFINSIFDILKQYSLLGLFIIKKKLQSFSEVIIAFENVINELLKFSIKTFWKGLISQYQFKIIKNIFENLQSIIEYVDDLSIIDLTSRKFRLLSKYVTFIFRIIHKTVTRLQGKLYSVWNLVITAIKLNLISVIFENLQYIINTVQDSKTFLLTGKLKTISKNLLGIFRILAKLIIFTSAFGPIMLIKCIVKLLLIKKIFALLAGVIAFATLAALVSVPFLILSLPFMAAMIAMCCIIEILINYARTISFKDLIKLFLLISIITMISMVGVAMVILALTAKTVMQNYGWILLFLVGLIPVILLMIVLGFLTIKIAILAAPCIIGMFAMAAMITAVMLIALQLKWLEKIQLDKQVIMENIDTVLAVAKSIIYSLFSSDDAQKDLDNAGKSKSWFGAFMGIFVSNKIMLQAILSAGIMALTFISVTMILLMVLELRVLQKESMSLDRGRVLDSVDKVLGTAKFINGCVFGGKYYDENAGEIKTNYDHDQKTWLGKVFTGIGTILNTICSSAIMMMSFISISMIWLMAKELTSLQKMELDKDTIATNIDKIVTTAKMVIDIVNAPSPTKEKNKDDGIIGKLLNFVLPSNMKYMIDAISTMGFTAITMVAIGIICRIGKQLTKIQELPALDKVQENTRMLMETSKQVIGIVEDQNFDVKKLATHIKAVKRIKNLIKGITDILSIKPKENNLESKIGELVASANVVITEVNDIKIDVIKKDRIDKVSEMFRSLKKLVNITNGVGNISIDSQTYIDYIGAVNKIMLALKPKGVGVFHMGKDSKLEQQLMIFKSLNESIKHTLENVKFEDISKITDHETQYIKFIELINKVAKELHPKSIGNIKRNRLDQQLATFGTITSFISKNISNIIDSSSYSFGEYKDTSYGKFIDILRSTCDDVEKLVTLHKPDFVIKYAKKLNNMIGEFGENSNHIDVDKLKETTDNYIKFLDKINSIKVNNLQKTTQMFKQMANFSDSINGNFDKLAETINEKLMPVLEELKSVMNESSDKLEKGFNSTTETLIATSPVPVSKSNMNSVVQASNPGMTPDQQREEAARRMEAQMKNQNNTLAAKLDEVIELLSGAGRINTVMTY